MAKKAKNGVERLGQARGSVKDARPPRAVPEMSEGRTPPQPPTLAVPEAPRQSDAFTIASYDGVKAVQSALIKCGLLDPPTDGGYGPVTKWALGRFAERIGIASKDTITPELAIALGKAEPVPLTPGEDLAGKLIKAMLRNNYWIARHPDCVNIAYIEGINPDGSLNDNRNNVFNDLRVVFSIRNDGVPVLLGSWEATTEPSRRWTLKPMDPHGAFHIKFGQYKAWIRGWHHTHEALVQAGEIEGYRDPHKTFRRDFNYPVSGADFGVNQHWGYDLPHDDMGNSSAGCLVGRTTEGHRKFMSLVLGDPRYRANSAYRFVTVILPAGDL